MHCTCTYLHKPRLGCPRSLQLDLVRLRGRATLAAARLGPRAEASSEHTAPACAPGKMRGRWSGTAARVAGLVCLLACGACDGRALAAQEGAPPGRVGRSKRRSAVRRSIGMLPCCLSCPGGQLVARLQHRLLHAGAQRRSRAQPGRLGAALARAPALARAALSRTCVCRTARAMLLPGCA